LVTSPGHQNSRELSLFRPCRDIETGGAIRYGDGIQSISMPHACPP
jgi:hypothetical protein